MTEQIAEAKLIITKTTKSFLRPALLLVLLSGYTIAGWGCATASFQPNAGIATVGACSGGFIQLGSDGSFRATATGTLRLYLNDALGTFFDNSGFWTVCITEQRAGTHRCVELPAAAQDGIAWGHVVKGRVYSFTAPGRVKYGGSADAFVDADGRFYSSDCEAIGGAGQGPPCGPFTVNRLIDVQKHTYEYRCGGNFHAVSLVGIITSDPAPELVTSSRTLTVPHKDRHTGQ